MPLTTEKYEKSLAQPPLCEQLKVRDLTDDLLIQLNGSFVDGYSGDVTGVAYSPDGKRLATAGQDGTAKVLDALSGQELLTLHGHSGHVYGVAYSPDGTRLATASLDTTAIPDGT